MSLEVYLIRHAESEANLDRSRIGGQTNWAELTPKGKHQAICLGKHFHSQGITFDTYYSSPAIRTQQTAHFCLEAMGQKYTPVQLVPDILELSQGDWEGQVRQTIYSRQDVQASLTKDNWHFTPGDKLLGESQYSVAQRMRIFLETLRTIHPTGRVVAFTHGLAKACLITDLMDFDKHTAYTLPMRNTGITILRLHPNSTELLTFNETPHLPEE